jgi:hypothetical protein
MKISGDFSLKQQHLNRLSGRENKTTAPSDRVILGGTKENNSEPADKIKNLKSGPHYLPEEKMREAEKSILLGVGSFSAGAGAGTLVAMSLGMNSMGAIGMAVGGVIGLTGYLLYEGLSSALKK